MIQKLRVALVHHWLVGMRGGEKVLEVLCDLFPQADVYTLVHQPGSVSEVIERHSIRTSWIQHLPAATRWYPHYLPLFPTAIEQLDLSNYDLVISSDTGVSKGVLTRPDSCHICYCHTPMRYAWTAYHTYLKRQGRVRRLLIPFFMNYLRTWDVTAASRVDHFVANSENVARRIHKYYRRDATVIYPPVEVQQFSPSDQTDDYFLAVGQLVPYKRFDLAVEVFNQLQLPLHIVGEGPEYSSLKKQSKENVLFLGHLPIGELRKALARCRALVFSGEEDFGMVLVEAHASGRPVIALGKGGALETVIPGLNGVLFPEETAESLMKAVIQFELCEVRFHSPSIRETAQRFHPERFKTEMLRFVADKWKSHARVLTAEAHRSALIYQQR